MLEIELGSSGRATSAHKHWANAPASNFSSVYLERFTTSFYTHKRKSWFGSYGPQELEFMMVEQGSSRPTAGATAKSTHLELFARGKDVCLNINYYLLQTLSNLLFRVCCGLLLFVGYGVLDTKVMLARQVLSH